MKKRFNTELRGMFKYARFKHGIRIYVESCTNSWLILFVQFNIWIKKNTYYQKIMLNIAPVLFLFPHFECTLSLIYVSLWIPFLSEIKQSNRHSFISLTDHMTSMSISPRDNWFRIHFVSQTTWLRCRFRQETTDLGFTLSHRPRD